MILFDGVTIYEEFRCKSL